MLLVGNAVAAEHHGLERSSVVDFRKSGLMLERLQTSETDSGARWTWSQLDAAEPIPQRGIPECMPKITFLV